LNRFNVLISKIIFKKWKSIIDIHFSMKNYLKNTRNHTVKLARSVRCKHCSPTHLSATSIWFPRATTSRFRSSNFQFILAALESHFRTMNECLFILNNLQRIIIFYMNYDGILKCWGFALMCPNTEMWSHIKFSF
jgi:hypothetical protein